MVDWGGKFLRKHVATVEFIPLEEMDEQCWAILDYENLRDVPKRRLQSKAMRGEVCGFHRVGIDMHKVHGGKEQYFWPANGPEFNDGDFDGFQGYDKDVEMIESFEKEYASLASQQNYEMEQRLISYGIAPARFNTWPRWAMIFSIIALERCRKNEDAR